MSADQFKPLPSEHRELLAAFKQHIVQAEQYAAELEGRHSIGLREKALLYCLDHALDLAKGCLFIAAGELPDSLTTLSRAILETLFWARYVTLSEDNAREFTDSPIHELKRTARRSLAAGYAHVADSNTKQDRSNEVLGSEIMKGIPPRVSIEHAAKAGGLQRVYTTIYGYISMTAHGRAFGLRTKSQAKDESYAAISAALGALECIKVIVNDWITHQEQTPEETLTRLLGA